MKHLISKQGVLFLYITLCLIKTGFSQTFDNGGGDNLWSNGTNWNPDGVPAAGATVTIQGFTVVVNSVETIGTVNIVGTTTNNMLDIQTGGTLNVTNDLTVTVANDNFHNDIRVQGTGVLNVGNDMIWTRPTTNTRDRRVRLQVMDNADCNVANDVIFNYGAGAETTRELLIQDDATFDVTGNVLMNQTGDGRDASFCIRDNSVATVGGNVIITQTDGNASVLDLLESGSLTIAGDLELTCNGHDNNPRIDLDDDCVLTVGDSVKINHGGGNTCSFNISDNSDVNITNSLVIDKTGGANFELDMTGTPTLDIGENLIGTNIADAGNDYITLDINGGTMTVVGTTDFEVSAASTAVGFVMFLIDGATVTTNGFNYDQNGGADGDMRIYLNRSQTAVAASFTCTSDLQFDHTDGDDMEIEVNDNSTFSVTGTTTFNNITSTDNDNIYLDINGGVSTFTGLVTMTMGVGVTGDSDLDVRMDACTVNYNGGFSFDSDGGDEVIWDVNTNSSATTSDINVTGDLSIDHDGGDNTLIRCYGNADIDISGDVIIDINSGDSDDTEFRVRSDVSWNIRDLIYTQDGGGEGTGENFDLFVNGNGILTVDDIIADLNTGSNFEIYINESGGLGNGGRLNITDSLSIDHETLAGDFYLRNSVNGSDSDIRIGTIYIDWAADGGDLIRIYNHGADDTLIVSNNIDIIMSTGTPGTDDDVRFDLDFGYFNIGGDLNATSSAGSDFTLDIDVGVFEIDGGAFVDWNNSRSISWAMNNTSSSIGTDLSLLNTGGTTISVNIDAGTHVVGRDMIIDMNACSGSSTFDQDGGDWTITEDFLFTSDGATTTDFFIDGTSNFIVGDSLFLDLNTSSNICRFYINNGVAGGATATIDHVYIDHEPTAHDVLFRITNDGRLNVTNSFVANHDASGGDYMEIEMLTASDTIIVGGDIQFNMVSGSNNGDDDMRIDIDEGYFDVSGDLEMQMSGLGAGCRYEQLAGDVNIGGDIIFNNTNSREIMFDINGGTLDVAGNIDIDHGTTNNTNNMSWDQDGGVVTVLEDFYITTNGHERSYFHFDNAASLTITDSLFIDVDADNNIFEWFMNQNAGTGSSVSASNIYIDHENTAQDFRILMNGDAKITVTNNIVVEHDADGGDYFEIQIHDISDTLIVGNDIIYTYNGSDNANDDCYFDSHGIVTIGNDFVANMTDGGGLRFEQDGGSIDIARYLTWVNNSSAELYLRTRSGSLTVGDDMTCTFDGDGVVDMDWDIDQSTVTLGADFYLNVTNGREAEIRVDDNSTVTIADSMFFNIDQNTSRTYFEIGSQTVGPSSVTIGSHIFADLEADAEDFYIHLDNDALLDVTNSITVINDADGNDYAQIQLSSADDTLLVGEDINMYMPSSVGGDAGDDLIIDVNGGFVDIGIDLILDIQNGGGDVRYQQAAGDVDVGRYMNLLNQNGGQALNVDIDGGTLDVTDDLTFTHANQQATHNGNWDQDGGIVTLGQDAYWNIDGNNLTNIDLDQSSVLFITDSLVVDLDAGTESFRIDLDGNAGTSSHLTVGTHLYIDHEASHEDVYIQTNNNSRIDIGVDLTVLFDANADHLELEMNAGTDTVIIGRDLLFNQLSGTGAAQEDVIVDQNGGFLSIGRDLIATIVDGDDLSFQKADGDTDIGRYMTMISNSSDAFTITHDDGTLDVGDDATFTHNNSVAPASFAFDVNDGDLTFNEDVYFTQNGGNESNWNMDDAFTMTIADSLLFDLDASSGITRFYINSDPAGNSGLVDIGTHFYIDHEANAADFLIRLDNNARLNVGVDLTAITDAAGGDYVYLDIQSADDTVDIGRDLIFTMTSGSLNANDDLLIDNSGGRLNVGRDVLMTNNGGGSVRFDHTTGTTQDTDIGRYLTLTSTNARDIGADIDGGTIDVVDDITVTSASPGYNVSWDQDGGILTANEDFYFNQNGNNNATFYLDNTATWLITDSIFFDMNSATAVTYFFINDNLAAGSGGLVDVGTHFYVDHEAASHDFLLRVDNDGRLNVGVDLTAIFDASGGDYCIVELETADDTLIVGRDIILNMPSGSLNTDDDVRIDNSGGRLQVGRDVLLTNNGGGSTRFDHTTGTTQDTDIGRYLTLINLNARDLSVNIDGGDIDVVDDITLTHQSAATYDFNWDQDGGNVETQEDLYINIDGNNATNFYLDNNSVLTVADTLLMNHDASTEIFRVESRSGSTIDVNNDIIIDHEPDADEVRLRMNTDGKIDVFDNIHIYHDAAGGDLADIVLETADDSLIVGNDIILNMSSGSTGADDDVRIDVNNGFVDVGNDVFYVGTAGSDLELYVDAGEMNIGRYLHFDGDNIDDIICVINGGTINVTDDVTYDLNASDDIATNFQGGTFNANTDMYFIANGSIDDINWRSINASIVNVADSLFFDLNSMDAAQIYFNDDGTTGSSLNVGNDIVIDHETSAGDVLMRLDGDALVNVTDDIWVYHDAAGGDYMNIQFEEAAGNDTLLVGGEINFIMSSGAMNSDDDMRIDQNGGYIRVAGDINFTATAGDDLQIDQSRGVIDALSNVNFNATDIDECYFEQTGILGTITVSGNVIFNMLRSEFGQVDMSGNAFTINGFLMMDSDDAPASGTVELEIDQGTNTIVGLTTLDINNSLNDAGDALIDINGGTNTFQSNVVLNVDTDSDDARLEISDGTTIFEDSILVTVSDASDDVVFDIDGGTTTVNEDVIINHNDSDDLEFDVDGGTFTVLEDLKYNANNVDEVDFWVDGPTSNLVITDTLFANLDITSGRFFFYMDNNVDGSEATIGTFHVDHEAAAQDVRIRLNGDATLNISNDIVYDIDALGGDYCDISVFQPNDSIIVGGDVIMDHYGSNNNNGDLYIDMNAGYFSVAGDVLISYDRVSGGDNDIILNFDSTAVMIVGDTFLIDANDVDDVWWYFNTNTGTDASVTAGNIVIDHETASDEVRIRLSSDSRLEATNNFTVLHDGSTQDFFQIDMNGANDSIVVGNDMYIEFNVAVHGNSDLTIDMEGGVILVQNDFEINMVDGDDCIVSQDNGSVIDVNNDFIYNQDGGDAILHIMNSGTGDPQLLVDNDMILDYAAGTSWTLRMNNSSTAVIGRDVQFNVNAAGLQAIDLNNDSEFYIARNFVRGATPNNFGELDAQDNATVIYNGTGAQIFSEDAGGGSDFFRYQNAIVNNTSGLLPAVTMESVDGGGATIYGNMTFTEGQLDINAERIFIDNTTPGAVTRTNGSVLSDRTDNASTMEWQMDAVTGTHLFPFSSAAGEYIPFIFETTAGNIGKVDVATYPTSSAASPNNLPYPTTPDLVTEMNRDGADNTLFCVDRFWQIDKSGASGTANMTWTYTDTELGGANTITENLLGAQRWNGTSWDSIVGTADAPNNQVTANAITSFSPWVLVQNNSPLPVELLSFSGEVDNEDVILKWVTASEINSDYFVVQRSIDGANFEDVTTVSAAGNSNSILSYSAIDGNPIKGESYYRLKQVDIDESVYYSDLVYISISESDNEFDVLIYPNPVQHNENFNIHAHGVEEHIKVTMIDLYGRTVYEGHVDIPPTGHAELHTAHLAAGVYTVYISDGNTQVVKRVVISK